MPPAARHRAIGIALAFALTTPSQAQQPPSFRSGVEIVAVHAVVTDADGRTVSGLTAEDFAVYEDDVARPIAQFRNDRVPVSLGIVLDTSFSMGGERYADTLWALDRLFTLLGREDEVFVLTVATFTDLAAPWTRDFLSVSLALHNVKPQGNTALFSGVLRGLSLMDRAAHRKRAMLIISDGNDREVPLSGLPGPVKPGGWSPAAPIPQPSAWESFVRRQTAVDRLARQETLVYALGVGSPNSHGHDPLDVESLRSLTDPTGGYTERMYANRDVMAAAARLAAELRDQYLIGYEPARAADGKFRRIRVVPTDPSLKVRARVGYVATRR